MKDFLTIGTSITAILLSIVTAYFQFRQIDDLRVVFREPFTSLERYGEEVSVHFSAAFTFVNSGNTVASVQNIELHVPIESESQEVKDCGYHDSDVIVANAAHIKPFVLRPGDIVTQEIVFHSFVIPIEKTSTKASRVAACLKYYVLNNDAQLVCPSFPAFRVAPDDRARDDFTEGEKGTRLLPAQECER